MSELRKRDIFCWGGYSTDPSSVMKSPSGGIGTALALHFLKQGGYVAGAVYSNDFSHAEYIVTNESSDIERLRGTKYVEVRPNGIYQKVIDLVHDDKKVLFIGLPCNVATLYKSAANQIICGHANWYAMDQQKKKYIAIISCRWKENIKVELLNFQ